MDGSSFLTGPLLDRFPASLADFESNGMVSIFNYKIPFPNILNDNISKINLGVDTKFL